MFCYTGIMIVGSKTKGYLDWRRKKEPILKDVESTVTEKPEESEEVTETPEEETPEETYELPP